MWPGKPYFSNERVAIYQGDSTQLVSQWPRRTFDLLVTDPPYGVDFKSGFNNHSKIQNDTDRNKILQALKLVMTPVSEGAHAYIFGFSPEDFEPLTLFGASTQLIWDKGSIGMGDLSSIWGPAHEPIAFGTYYPYQSGKGKGALSAKLRKGSVLRVPRKNSLQNIRHPTEKPVVLLSQLIESSSCVNDLVFDPFAGVGSTGVAALLLQRRCVLIELEEKYCEIAAKRCDEASQIAEYCETM